MNDLTHWREDFREDYEGMNETVMKALLVDIGALLSRVTREMQEKPQSMRIPCPEGKAGCLVIHYGPDALTPEQVARNRKLDFLLRKTLGIQEP